MISAPFEVQSPIPAENEPTVSDSRIRVDGNDVVACHAAAKDARDRARAGEGPNPDRGATYRRNPHTTSDDDLRYRSTAENEELGGCDPIERLREHLANAGDLVDDAFFAELALEEEALAEYLRAGCRALPVPSRQDRSATPWRTCLPAGRQMEEHLAFVASGEGGHE